MQENSPRRQHRDNPQAPEYSAQDARGGEIILRTRTRRLIFIVGLVGIVMLAILIRLFT